MYFHILDWGVTARPLFKGARKMLPTSFKSSVIHFLSQIENFAHTYAYINPIFK